MIVFSNWFMIVYQITKKMAREFKINFCPTCLLTKAKKVLPNSIREDFAKLTHSIVYSCC
ncbi:MAG TPA: hypothetical protein DCS93_42700 [Microscillaceae bacterium]|nr:hypothetical protein [Microscillaceae bacterium]